MDVNNEAGRLLNILAEGKKPTPQRTVEKYGVRFLTLKKVNHLF